MAVTVADSTEARRRRRRGVGLAVWIAVAVSAGLVAGDLLARTDEGLAGYLAALGTMEGVSEASVLEKAGVPSRLVQPPTGRCAERGGARELVYELTSRGFGGWGRIVLEAQVVLCVSADGRVLETMHIEF